MSCGFKKMYETINSFSFANYGKEKNSKRTWTMAFRKGMWKSRSKDIQIKHVWARGYMGEFPMWKLRGNDEDPLPVLNYNF